MNKLDDYNELALALDWFCKEDEKRKLTKDEIYIFNLISKYVDRLTGDYYE